MCHQKIKTSFQTLGPTRMEVYMYKNQHVKVSAYFVIIEKITKMLWVLSHKKGVKMHSQFWQKYTLSKKLVSGYFL